MTEEIAKQIIAYCGMPVNIAKAVAYQKKLSYEAGYLKATLDPKGKE